MRAHVRALLRDAPPLRTVAHRWASEAGRPAPRTRFAPSPTGELHLGHVVHALWVWGVADAVGAGVVLRMEDHDRSRCTPAFEASILDDLAWVGFVADRESTQSLHSSGPSSFRQSDVDGVYRDALARLAAVTPVYGCTCTRSMLGPSGPDGERRYPGTCRGFPIDRGEPAAVRVTMPDVQMITDDLLLGPLIQWPAREHGDVVVRDASRQWTYQLCVVVDDIRHGVNLVVRGHDLVTSTGRQQLLRRMLGPEAPFVTVHHPLVMAPNGRKLSKRDRSDTVAAMRGRGMTADDVIDAAWSVSGLPATE